MKLSAINTLLQISEIMIKEISLTSLAQNLKEVLSKSANVTKIQLYVFDELTNTLRDCNNNWKIVSADNTIQKEYKLINGHDCVINDKAYKIPQVTSDITFNTSSLALPLYKLNKLFGIIKIEFLPDTYIDIYYLYIMKIIASQVGLKLHNIVLTEQSNINVNFHDSMKNIAKIIETQYELNYIVPLIGEMLDRFISDHLIYIFLMQDNQLKLIWPKACNDTRIYETIENINSAQYILTPDNKIGAFPLLSEDGEIIGCIVARSTLEKLSIQDIGYLEQLTRQSAITINRANTYSKVLQYATIDALTNLNNRRQFEIRLKQEIATTKRQNNPLCAMMIDIDFFKKVNDTYGHASGDTVLKTVASVIKEKLRESDIPSRYGGEEFAVLLPYTHIEEAKIVGERLRQAIQDKEIQLESNIIKVTISMGLAEFDNIETGEQLFERADKALYKAKTSGRNQIQTI